MTISAAAYTRKQGLQSWEPKLEAPQIQAVRDRKAAGDSAGKSAALDAAIQCIIVQPVGMFTVK
jgi:hypothetical protein